MIKHSPMKKVVLLNCRAVFVLFNVCVLLISCAKKQAEEIKEAGASPSKPAAEVPVKPTKFTPQMVVAAFEKAADRMPPDSRAKMMERMPLNDPAKMAEMTEEFNAELASGEVELKEISVDALADWIVQMEKPPSASARAKGARIKCVNNLSSIGKAMLGFSQDNGSRTPWNLIPSQKSNHFGSNYNLTVGSIFGLAAMKYEVQTAKILISPCDKGRFAANEKVQEDWRNYNTKGGKPIPHDGLSYGLCFGADTQRPATILGTTRNLSADELAKSIWAGAEDAKRGMAGLQMGQGQIVTMDGGPRQSSKDDIGEAGRRVKAHINSRGGQARGNASTRMALPY